MCNIAGYAGTKQAAPLLLEMIRRQEPFDGDMSVGVVTIHEGKLHYRKAFGTADELIQNTDVLELPGTIGIAHTRPGATREVGPMQPFLSGDDRLALAVNGNGIPGGAERTHKAAAFLEGEGYTFRYQWQTTRTENVLPSSGKKIHGSESRAHYVDYYIQKGERPERAMALMGAHLYSDVVSVLLHRDFPDQIVASRTTRGMEAVIDKGETYIATTRFGLPEHLADRAFSLPLFHSCIITRGGVQVTDERIDAEPVSEMTPYTYAEGYRRIEAILRGGPTYFDDLEVAVKAMRDLWPGDYTCVQHARLVYDILWQFECEGRLKKELRVQQRTTGTRRRWYFHLEG